MQQKKLQGFCLIIMSKTTKTWQLKTISQKWRHVNFFQVSYNTALLQWWYAEEGIKLNELPIHFQRAFVLFIFSHFFGPRPYRIFIPVATWFLLLPNCWGHNVFVKKVKFRNILKSMRNDNRTVSTKKLPSILIEKIFDSSKVGCEKRSHISVIFPG